MLLLSLLLFGLLDELIEVDLGESGEEVGAGRFKLLDPPLVFGEACV